MDIHSKVLYNVNSVGTEESQLKKIEIGVLQLEGNEGITQIQKQEIFVTSKPGQFASKSDWERYLDDVFIFGTYYQKYNFIAKIPDNEILQIAPDNPLFAKSHSYYNFRIRAYEDHTSLPDVNELDMPCFMDGVFFKTLPNSPMSNRLYTRDGTMGYGSDVHMLTRVQGVNKNYFMFSNEPQRTKYLEDNYFHKYTLLPPLEPESMQRKNNYLISLDYNVGRNNHVVEVPFFNKIEMSHISSDTHIKEAFEHEWIQGKEMLLNIIKNTNKNSLTLTSPEPVLENDFLPSGGTVEDKYPRFNLVDAIENYSSTNLDDEVSTYVFDTTQSIHDSNLSVSESDLDISIQLLIGILRTKMSDMAIPLETMIDNKDVCYSEFLAYKVEKVGVGLTPLQTFYFYNFNKAKTFIDTQVKFGKTYSYNISGFWFLAGQRYAFELVNSGDSSVQPSGGDLGVDEESLRQAPGYSAEIKLIAKPVFDVIEIPIVSKPLMIVEPPPPEPIVKIEDVRGVDHKIRLCLKDNRQIKTSTYQRRSLPIIEEGEDEAYASMLNGYCYSDNHYFSHVASDSSFDVYRLEEEPKSIGDFGGNIIYSFRSSKIDAYGFRHPSHYVYDYLEHKKKYYYLFRNKTHYGNPSLPSPIYVVEKYKDADATILKVNKYVPKDSREFYENKFRRFMRIRVNQGHFRFGEASLQNPNSAKDNLANYKLGSGDADIWRFDDDNHIKLRLESKNTGKKIDINLLFRYNKPTI